MFQTKVALIEDKTTAATKVAFKRNQNLLKQISSEQLKETKLGLKLKV